MVFKKNIYPGLTENIFVSGNMETYFHVHCHIGLNQYKLPVLDLITIQRKQSTFVSLENKPVISYQISSLHVSSAAFSANIRSDLSDPQTVWIVIDWTWTSYIHLMAEDERMIFLRF